MLATAKRSTVLKTAAPRHHGSWRRWRSACCAAPPPSVRHHTLASRANAGAPRAGAPTPCLLVIVTRSRCGLRSRKAGLRAARARSTAAAAEHVAVPSMGPCRPHHLRHHAPPSTCFMGATTLRRASTMPCSMGSACGAGGKRRAAQGWMSPRHGAAGLLLQHPSTSRHQQPCICASAPLVAS